MLNKIIIITGGSSGIGNAAAKLFSKHGSIVYVLDKKQLRTKNSSLRFISCDVSEFKQVKHAIKQVIKEEKRIDAVFANAGEHFQAGIENTSLSAIDKIINTNLKGILYTLKAVLPIMRKQSSKSSIVLMGSDQSQVGKPENTIYGATKAAIAQLAKSLALDYAKHDIRVNCVCPGATFTPLIHKAIGICAKQKDVSYAKMYSILDKDRPMQRFGKPEEIAELVYFLCSDKASFMTGSVVNIDGGYTAG